MRDRERIRGTVAAAALLALMGTVATQGVRADDDDNRRLVFAAYKSETAAKDAFKTLKAADDKDAIDIESYAVISKGLDGKVKVKDQRKKGARAGAVVGAVVGLLGGPVGVAVGAAAGGTAGYLTGNAVGMSKDTVEKIKSSLQPGESAIIAVVEEEWGSAAEKLQEAKAVRITSYQIPPAPKAGGAEGKSAPPETAPMQPSN
jgi:uncharacterized membrane protein